MRIRRATPADASFVRDVALAVFSRFGPYGRLLPEWLLHPDVVTFLAEEDGVSLGYVMLALVPFDDEESMLRPGPSGIADLVAIAVAPEAQRRGVGRALLRYALEAAGTLAQRLGLREVRLSVADTNAPARALFEREGFRVLDPAHGYYAGGQRSIRMSCRLPPLPSGLHAAPAADRDDGRNGR